MCGIHEIFHTRPVSVEERQSQMQTMLNLSGHRGPDKSDIAMIGNNTVLGMNRLAIIAPGEDATVQTDGMRSAVFNGEIVNHTELRRMLGSGNISGSDIAVILPLLKKNGPNYVRHLAGMFAIGVHEHDTGKVQMGRDPLGVKPLYYHVSDKGLIYSSEIKAIASVMSDAPEVDFAAIDHGLRYRFHPGRTSVFPDIHRVLPGELVTYQNGRLSQERYWDLKQNPETEQQEASVEEFRELLVNVITEHAQADVPGGFFVSGGLDSSLVTSIALQEAQGSFTRPISLRFIPNAVVDEQYGKLLEKYLGTKFEWVDVTDADAREALVELVNYMDEPLENPIHIGTYLMAKRAREIGVKTVLTGDGSDEFFLGYQRHEPWFDGTPDPGNVYKKWLWTMTPEEADELYTEDAKELLHPMLDVDGNPIEPFIGAHQALRFERRERLSEYHNMRLDRATMAHSIEARVPLQDHRIVEYALRLPMGSLFGGSGKAWLQEVSKPWVPPEIIHRKKIHFPSLPDQWLSGEGAEWVSNILLDPGARNRVWLRPDTVERYIAEHKEGKSHGRLLWALATMELWLQSQESWRSRR